MKQYNYIYLITNKINGKIYIGKHSTDNLNDGYMGSGIIIKRAIAKDGKENFTKEYLAFCDNEDTLNYLEKFYIKKYKAKEVGYNLTDGGDGHLGFIMSEETKEKLSKSHKGKHLTEEHKQKLSEATKKQLVEKGSPFKGRHHTEESKLKMRQSAKNRPPMSTQQKQKISRANKGKTLSEEHKQKIRMSNIGHSMPYYKWLTENNEIKIMTKGNVSKWHPNWKLIEKL